jgi:hypothetical protein
MYREFILTKEFDKCWNMIGLSDDDLCELQDILVHEPKCGRVIRGTGGIRKMRASASGRGKRGGARIIYLDVEETEQTYLLLVYPKNKKDSLSTDDKWQLAQMAKALKG